MASATEASEQANRSTLDPKRLVVIFYLLAALLVGLFFANVISPLWAALNLPNPEIFGLAEWTASRTFGFALAAAIAIACYLNPKIHKLSLETSAELMKVTWPSWAETKVSTIAVIVASVVAALILFTIDWIALRVMVEWLPAVWGKL